MRADTIEKTPVIVTLSLVVAGLIVLSFSLWGLSIIGVAGIFLILCCKKIPADPPHVGLTVIWGERRPKIKKEGWRLLAPFFPFMYDVILIKVESINLDFLFEDIRTRQRLDPEEEEQDGIPQAGGELTIKISITFHPDKEKGGRLIEYLNRGGQPGVERILRDLIEEDIRHIACERHWEAITFGADELMWQLIGKLTERKPRTEEEKTELRREFQTVGLPDVMHLGIVLTRINVGRIKEQGDLARVAELRTVERKQREAEILELDHVGKQIERLRRSGLSAKEARDVVQTERGKVKKDIHEIIGIDLEGLGRGIREGLRDNKKRRRKKRPS